MSYDKVLADGTVIKAPKFTYCVLGSVPALFQLAEWLLVIVAFQYVDARYGYMAAKVAWLFLSFALAAYVGFLSSNLLWRETEDPYKNRRWKLISYGLLPAISAALVYALQHLAKQMVLAQQAEA